MNLQRVMVSFSEGDLGVTYEVDGPVKVGDRVRAEWGNWNPQVLVGVVIAIGSQPRTHRNGYIEPPYDGPCKRAVVIERAHAIEPQAQPQAAPSGGHTSSPLVAALAQAVLDAHAKRLRERERDG